jgi:hypothetical protein
MDVDDELFGNRREERKVPSASVKKAHKERSFIKRCQEVGRIGPDVTKLDK